MGTKSRGNETVTTTRLPRSRLRALVFVVALVALAWVIRANRRDRLADAIEAVRRAGHPTSGAELDARWPRDPDAQDAGERLTRAAREIRGEDDWSRIPHESGWETNVAADWSPEERAAAGILRSNDLAQLVLLHEALGAPDIRLGDDFAQGIQSRGVEVFGFISSAKVLACVAEWEVLETPSLTADAFGHLADGLEMSRLLGRESGLIAQIGALAVGHITLRGVERVLTRTTATEDQWTTLQSALERVRSKDRSVRALEGELCLGLAAAEVARTNIVPLVSVSGPGMTPGQNWPLQMMGRIYSGLGLLRSDVARYVEIMGLNLDAAQRNPRERVVQMMAVGQMAIAEIAERRVTRRFCSVMLPRVYQALSDDLRYQSRTEAAIAAVAIERYRLAHGGALPASLETLVPRFLPAVPVDPFDNPLRFRPLEVGYVVYSLGDDLQDDGGFDRWGQSGGREDVAFRVLR